MSLKELLEQQRDELEQLGLRDVAVVRSISSSAPIAPPVYNTDPIKPKMEKPKIKKEPKTQLEREYLLHRISDPTVREWWASARGKSDLQHTPCDQCGHVSCGKFETHDMSELSGWTAVCVVRNCGCYQCCSARLKQVTTRTGEWAGPADSSDGEWQCCKCETL
eukprot:TRINITY_DN94457_c0_g1_i1.p1 TRINITY_DN94457_c0_g1~~TRINITY_DN94457_c0_g1_i1.p1  ORF type:complete len:164 (+),score=11.14 TRINITY_DN94457_c0_g1_i1:55-546(+)